MTSDDMRTDDRPEHGPGGNGCGCAPTPEGCDTELIDKLACRAKGVAAQAAYDTTYQVDLDAAKIAYDVARKAYRTGRQEAGLSVGNLRHEVRQQLDKIRCLIAQKRVWRCLDSAFAEIVTQLEACGGDTGCCVGECDFSLEGTDDLGLTELVALRVTYQQRTDEAKACFTALTGEPAALAARVLSAQGKVDEIRAALADPATTDLKKVYVEALVADRDLSRVWAGFEQSQDFVECLCRALTCWTEGCAAVSVLTGLKAVKECRQQSADDRCTHLRTETVEEVLAAYDRLCTPCEHEEEPEEPPSPPDDHDHECECGHHNHHHHQPGCSCRCHRESAE